MPALYTITTRASGTILTAAIYNTDHQNHVNNGDAQHLGGFSANTSQMRTQTSPGDVGSESLSLSIADELARIRYMIALQRGTTFWYGTAAAGGAGWGFNYLRNSNFLVAQRMGQANMGLPASAGAPYYHDQWYVYNGVGQAGTVFYGGPLITGDLASIGVNRTTGQTGTGQMWVGQPFTLAQLAPLRGQQVTASVSFTTGPGFSPTFIVLQVVTGTGTAARLGVGNFVGQANSVTVNQATTPSMPITRIQATGIIPNNASQLEWRVLWNPIGTAIGGDTINIGDAKLEPGAQPTPYIPPDPYVELQELATFYFKTFQLGILPAQNAGQQGAFFMNQSTAASVQNLGNNLRWPTRMIKPPTIVLYNPSAFTAQARNTNLPADCTGTIIQLTDESGIIIQYTAAVGSVAGQANGIHLTADAGL